LTRSRAINTPSAIASRDAKALRALSGAVVPILRLVAIERVGPQRRTQREIGRLIRAQRPVRKFSHDRDFARTRGRPSEDAAPKLHHVFGLSVCLGADADDNQP
jgi:hypothetical protein